MTVDDVKPALTLLDLRVRLILKLAVFAGLRPGEIFATCFLVARNGRAPASFRFGN
jgi:hypothetical protein